MSAETKNKIQRLCSICSNIEEHMITSENFMELANKFKNTNYQCESCRDLYQKTSAEIFPDNQVYPFPKYYIEITFDRTSYSGHGLGRKTCTFPLLKIFKKEDMTFTGDLDIYNCKEKLKHYKLPKKEREVHEHHIQIIKAKICMDQRLLINLD